MKVQSISGYSFTQSSQKREHLTDKFHEKTVNAADFNDVVVVPRTIFKGYLGFMAGTTLTSLAGLIDKTKHPTLSKSVTAVGLLTCLYGTWAFVRPYVVKDTPGVDRNPNKQ